MVVCSYLVTITPRRRIKTVCATGTTNGSKSVSTKYIFCHALIGLGDNT